MRKLLTTFLTLALLAVGAALAFAAVQGPSSTPAGSVSDDTTDTTETTTTRDDVRRSPSREVGEDVSGPCDEAEHANDPRCTGQPAPAPAPSPVQAGQDISGPCDEAEHVNDPRCTGATTVPGQSGRGHDDDGDHSGPGHGGDDDSGHDDDSSGHGGGNSGHGGGDDD